MSVVLGRIQSDGYSYSDTLWSPSGTWSYEEAVENDDNTISARSYFEDGTMTENGVAQPNYAIKATPNRIGDTRLDDTPIEKSLTALRIYAERVEHQSFLDFLVTNHIAFVDPRAVIDTSGAYDIVVDGGLDNTGATDVSAALQSIIDTHPKIHIPAGTFLLESGLLINNITTLIYGEGELLRTSTVDFQSVLRFGGVTLSGSLIIDGITFNLQATGTWGACLSIYWGVDNYNTVVQNCTFKAALTVAHNGIGGFGEEEDERIIGNRFINNTFINIGRIGIEINDRIRTDNTSVMDTEILYNRFLFDPDSDQVTHGGDHMFISITGGAGETPSQTMNTTVIGNYAENCVVGMEINELTDTSIKYNTFLNIDEIMFGVSVNKYVGYNYFEVSSGNTMDEKRGTNNTYKYNQIIGNVYIGDNDNIVFNHNSVYTVDVSEPVRYSSVYGIEMKSNYVEGIGVTGSRLIRFYDINNDSTTVVEDNRGYSDNGVPVILESELVGTTYSGNVDLTEREALFPRVMPKMFK